MSVQDTVAGVGATALFVLNIALGIAQLAAFMEGIEIWLGYGAFASIVIFVLAYAVPFGSIGTTAVAMYGAIVGWHWAWWQAALLCLPYLLVGLVLFAFGITADAIGRRRGSARS